MNTRGFCIPLSLVLFLAGCHGHSLPAPASAQEVADQHAVLDTEREQLELIPPPSKNRYMSVHTFESWENPYITVQASMLTLHVLIADANTSNYGAGGILRPVGARRQELNISLDKLADAISAVPQSSWPYGRVIALEEAHKTPANAKPQVRRTMETAVNTLNDLGVVVYDLNDGKLQ
ncbi:hypothetical protein [Granulicella sp. S156]|uniref:hypothetical protein n=1 Tax=Granulicella sp. S156 TaxID=1747224 RepID=UPI00131EB8EE|nr:hypothetical protein [Granulicella sp. S156]